MLNFSEVLCLLMALSLCLHSKILVKSHASYRSPRPGGKWITWVPVSLVPIREGLPHSGETVEPKW